MIDRMQRILDTESDPSAAGEAIARVLFPYDPNAGVVFYRDAARYVLSGVISALMGTARDAWTMADAASVFEDWDTTKAVLTRDSRTVHVAEEFSDMAEEKRTGIMETVAAVLLPFKDRLETVRPRRDVDNGPGATR